MKPQYQHLTLTAAEQAHRNGALTLEELEEYLTAWNATPGRFTVATWRDGAIRQQTKGE